MTRDLVRPVVEIVAALFLSAFLSANTVAATVPQRFDDLIASAKASMLVDPRKAIEAARAAEGVADRTGDPEQRQVMRATAEWLMGEAYLRVDEGDRAAPLIEQAYAAIKDSGQATRLHGDLLLSMGGIAVDKGDVASALSYYQNAHRVFRGLKETRSQAKALIQIANLYYEANDWRSSLRYYREALDTYDADPNFSVSIHNGQGIALKELGRAAAAQQEFDKALVLARQLDSPLLVATVLNNAARLNLNTGNLVKADRAIAESIRVTGKDTPPEFRKQQEALAAQAAYQHRDYPRAAALIAEAFAGADLAKTALTDREAHRTAFLTFQALHRDDLALVHLRALKRLDDDATNLARSTGAALMGARFDFANQALRIANLKAEDAQKSVAFERARAQTQRLIFLGAAAATMIIIGMLLYALRTSRRSRERVQAANDDLAVTNDALGKALAAKTEFLATTSHEIRTPLNGILGMTQVMLVDETIGAATQERLKLVHEAGVNMRALVDDILDVAKMETGNLTIETAAFDLKSMAMDATRLWEDQARGKGLAFALDLDDCPGSITGDVARVRQILFNLLSNAVKFTAAGTIALRIARTDGNRYRITVTDSGVGIPTEQHEAIFESFRQADTSTTRQFGGTGLGLAICRNLARAMDGDVMVHSVVGEGATFVVDLPLVAADAVAAIDRPADGRIDLLVVDRNPITRNMLRSLFAPHLATIEVAGSLPEAIERVAGGGVARVLADEATVRMGDVLADLAALAGAGEARIALLWPVGAAAERDDLLGTGIDLVIAKPVTGAALVERLLAVLQDRNDPSLVSQAA